MIDPPGRTAVGEHIPVAEEPPARRMTASVDAIRACPEHVVELSDLLARSGATRSRWTCLMSGHLRCRDRGPGGPNLVGVIHIAQEFTSSIVRHKTDPVTGGACPRRLIVGSARAETGRRPVVLGIRIMFTAGRRVDVGRAAVA
jgi:hypothetical protein